MAAPNDPDADRDDDLAAGVAQGIITDAQAVALRALTAEREKARTAALSHEERFRFMRGFNDFFFASGVLLFGAGGAYFTETAWAGNLAAAVVIWLLAELLVGRMRLVLPGLLLVLFFAYFVALAVPIDFWVGRPAGPIYGYPTPFLGTVIGYAKPAVAIARALLVAIGGLVFFARFRFPFALLPVAGGLVIAAMTIAQIYLPFVAAYAMLFLCGLLVFAAAMAFDVTDPDRTTRRADCAFWLHLLAAPLIVHSFIRLTAGDSLQFMTTQAAMTIVGVVVVLTLVAVVIDRRALLVSTLTYLGIVIAYALKAATFDQTQIFFATLFVLGALVLGLGVGWLPLRRGLMKLVPSRLSLRLPPVLPVA